MISLEAGNPSHAYIVFYDEPRRKSHAPVSFLLVCSLSQVPDLGIVVIFVRSTRSE